MEVNGQLYVPVALSPRKGLPYSYWLGDCLGPNVGLDAACEKIISKDKFVPVLH